MTSFLIAIIVLALMFDYINGFHDAANSIATVVSTKVLTPLQAVLWAALFNFVAYFIFTEHNIAGAVSKTVKPDFITLEVIFSGLIAAIIWNLLTWWSGIPSSSSHTLMGGFAGAAIAHAGSFNVINSPIVLKTIGFIVLAPLIGMIMAFIISLWFISSFRKGWGPKLFSLLVIAGVLFFLYNTLEFRPEKLTTHFSSYVLKVIFQSKNLTWLLLGLIIIIMAVFTLYLSGLNSVKSHKWFKKLQLVSSAISALAMAAMMPKK